MIDLHTHSFFSDGVLAPCELIRRCQMQGYRGLVLADHVDPSNLQFIVESVVELCETVEGAYEGLQVLPGCELTHVPPLLIPGLIEQAREAGAEVVLVHGETIVEPVQPGTNRAAIEGVCDVLAHPGLISAEEAAMAARAGVKLEISGRKGHSLTNGHVARLAGEAGADLTFGSDGHVPGDYPTRAMAEQILLGAGLSKERIARVFETAAGFFNLPATA